MRKTEFANGEYYHIYNRGVDKREVFLGEKDYVRFIRGMKEFNRLETIGSLYEKDLREKRRRQRKAEGSLAPLKGAKLPSASVKLVEIICYCLNPNHFHMILKQLQDKGIEKFMHKLGTSHTNYFNRKENRSGSLFQGPFRSIYIESNNYLLYLSAYVNANNFIHGYNRNIDDWAYSSYLDYIGRRNGVLCDKKSILGQFKDAKECEEFIRNNALYLKGKKEMEKYLLE